MSLTEDYRTLVAHLASKEVILAALVMDQAGDLVVSEGEAHSVRSLPDPGQPESDLNALERAFVVPSGDVFVVVIFDETTKFEDLSELVTQTVENVLSK